MEAVTVRIASTSPHNRPGKRRSHTEGRGRCWHNSCFATVTDFDDLMTDALTRTSLKAGIGLPRLQHCSAGILRLAAGVPTVLSHVDRQP